VCDLAPTPIIEMILDLSEIVHHPGMNSSVEIRQECLDDPEIVCLEPLEGRVEFRNAGSLLMIDGDVAVTVELTCDRCLTAVPWPTTVHLEERFPLTDVIHPPREPTADQEFDNTVSSVVHLEASKPILDLDELIRQQLLTQVPMQVLCDEACRGLCPRCGANLNESACACPAETEDSPLAALSSLLEDDGNGKRGDG
jgi:uncharacterized protein